MAKDGHAPSVAVVAAAHNEERRYRPPRREPARPGLPGLGSRSSSPRTRSTDGMDALVEGSPGGTAASGSSAARAAARWRRRTQAVRTIEADIVAFADAGAVWEPDALRMLVRSLADPEVGYVAGKVAFREPEGTNREGLYWRYELWLRGRESAARLDHGRERSHLRHAPRRLRRGRSALRSRPHLPVRDRAARQARGLRRGRERLGPARPATSRTSTGGRCACSSTAGSSCVRGGMLRGVGPLYLFELFAHRVLRYASGILHVVLLATSLALVRAGSSTSSCSPRRSRCSCSRRRPPADPDSRRGRSPTTTCSSPGRRWRRSSATSRFGVPPVWEKVEGTR